MKRCLALLILALASVVSAHFQLQFPPPRGVFAEDDEPTFCDGYSNPATNRTTFPLSGGFFSLNSEHPQFTTGVLVSTAGNPTAFSNFTQVVPFFQTRGEGVFCFPLDFSANSTFQDGQNVTIQIVFDGGDSNLYQCADLTLSNNFKISSDVTCSNATGNGASSTSTSPSTASTGSTTGAPASTQPSSAIGKEMSATIIGLMLSAVCVSFL